MEENFDLLLLRIIDALLKTNLDNINNKLNKITDNVICVGSGGSAAVSEFASKLFNYKYGLISINVDPRDTLYLETDNYKNIFICSYSGNNYGVEVSLKNRMKKYIFTASKSYKKDAVLLSYENTLKQEKSFISLAGTLIPMSILLNCYINNARDIIIEMFDRLEPLSLLNNNVFEILTGYDTSVVSKFIDSTFTEAGLGQVIIHSKYDYHHGRSTLSYHHDKHTLIYLKTKEDEMTHLHLKILKKQYKQIIVLESNYHDIILDNYYLTLQAIYLSKNLANLQNKDLSNVNYSPLTQYLYKFKGTM